MKKYKIHFLAAMGLLLMIVGFSSAYGSFRDSITVKNHIAMGDVNISLKEYQIKNGKEIAYYGTKTVLPGDLLSKIPRIKNLGMPCWIRTKVSFENEKDSLQNLKEDHIRGIPKEWKKIGEYFYYTKILESGKSVDFFTGIKIPHQWDEQVSGKTMKLKIQADAIQAFDFQPDFHRMSPWGNQRIETCIHESDGKIQCRFEKVKMSVKFSGAAGKLLAVPDDFFRNLGTLMPGGEYKDTIMISNTDKKDVEIYFNTGIEHQTAEQLDLLEKTELKIFMDGKTLYQGNLKASSLEKPVSLGKFQSGKTGQLEFILYAPENMKNEYALKNAAVNWTFSVSGLEKEENSTASTEDSFSQTYDSQKYTGGGAYVKTGDNTPFLWFVCLLILSGGIVLLYLRKKKKGGRS